MDIIAENLDISTACELSALGFDKPITSELIADVSNHIGGDLVVRILEDNADIGFATFETYGNLLYLCGIMLKPSVQGRGYAAVVIKYAQEITQSKYLALRTQNPKMWSVGKKMCGIWLPEIHSNSGNLLPKEALDNLQSSKGLQHPIDIGCYGGPLYGTKPIHRDGTIQQWWDGICNFERGDGVVCIGLLNPTHN
jgi:hypothetical protein